MSKSIATKRYAEALFQLGQEHDTLDDMATDLKTITDGFREKERIYTYLEHPRVKYVEKKQFLTETFQGIQPMILDTVLILVERGSVEMIPEVSTQLIQMIHEARGIAVAQIYSVRKLTESEEQSLAASFAKRFNKQTIQVENMIDPSILGGLKIRVGHTVFDGSTKGKLNRLERSIVTADK